MLPWLPARAIPQLITKTISMPTSGLIIVEFPVRLAFAGLIFYYFFSNLYYTLKLRWSGSL